MLNIVIQYFTWSRKPCACHNLKYTSPINIEGDKHAVGSSQTMWFRSRIKYGRSDYIFVEPAFGERDIAFTIFAWCVCVR